MSDALLWLGNHVPSIAAAVGAFIAAARAGRGETETKSIGRKVNPVSNGFAGRMESKLDSLQVSLTDTRQEMHEGLRDVRQDLSRHVADHAQAGMRDRK